MSRQLNLTAVATVTLDGSGNGTAQLGPSNTNEVWSPASVTISCNGSLTGITGTTTCQIFSGSSSPSTLIDGTYNPLQDSTGAIQGWVFYPGMYVFAVWTNGPASQQATLVVNGTRTVP